MGATTIGAIVGAAIDGMSGDDGAVDGAITGAVAANVLKVAVPVVATSAIAWLVLRGLGAAWDRATGERAAGGQASTSARRAAVHSIPEIRRGAAGERRCQNG